MALYETVRCFVGLNLDIAGVRRVVEVMGQARPLPGSAALRWVVPTKLHVTLKFWGEIDRALVPAIKDALSALSVGRATPQLVFSGFSAFPSENAARVLFAKTEDVGGEAAKLAAAIDEIGEQLGLTRESRRYHPHLTVARAPTALDLRSLISRVPAWRVSVGASEMVLYRSDTASAGSEYEALGRFSLGSRAPLKAPATHG